MKDTVDMTSAHLFTLNNKSFGFKKKSAVTTLPSDENAAQL